MTQSQGDVAKTQQSTESEQKTNSNPEKKKVTLSFLAALWPYLSRYKKVMAGAATALIITAMISLLLGQGVRLVIDEGIGAESMTSLNAMLGVVMAMVIVMAVGTFIRFYLVTWLGERISADIRNDVFKHLVRLHPSFFEENQSGEIMSRLTTDTTLLQSIIGSSLSFALRNALTVSGGLIMLFVTNMKLTSVVLLGVPAVLVPALWMGRRVRNLSRESQDTVADVGTYAGEIIRQVKTVQSYSRENFEIDAFGKEVDKAFNVAKKRILTRSALLAIVIFLSFSAIASMVWVGGYDVMNGNMTAGELAAFVFYALMVAFGVAGVSEVYGEIQRAAGATERLMELLSEQTLISDPENPFEVNTSSKPHLALNQVTFAYPSRLDRPALDKVTLDVQRGETIALVGPSGAGKSTLFELLLRFYDPQQGNINLLNTNIKDIRLNDLRTNMALVPQQPVLFSRDVWYNIRYGKPDATDEEVIAAAKAAFAYDFIMDLPDGFSSHLGENGVRLSGGQKQRLVIARAILNDPEILLLDEATSALDAESEFQVQKALDVLMENRTTLIIAHRLATVLGADRTVVLDKGAVVAQGTHESLIASSVLYKRLADLQFGET
ncbi:ABC transporter transmembrane domain-containing protein [Reinekea sp.]|jgi:ATP-binding cassette subfamily B protein|uniref:ABC transporter transmembrane domain-containing protein n=1 Tax=Reinekea sp. TaxID=1970455 RepID=UPI00398A33AE